MSPANKTLADSPIPIKLALRDKMYRVFFEASSERDQRQNFVDGRYPEWVIYERQRMWETVNQERAKLGKPPVEISVVERVERIACGHVDYSSKYALYCAELVLDDFRGP